MNKNFTTIAMALTLSVLLGALPALASDSKQTDHSQMDMSTDSAAKMDMSTDSAAKMDMSTDSAATMDHSGRMGEMIHQTTVNDYKLAYHLLEMEDRDTHHMMVYVYDSKGQPVEGMKVGFLVEGPDGAKQKLMCMGMQGAYGADANFKTAGSYTIRTKAVMGATKLTDKFVYSVP